MSTGSDRSAQGRRQQFTPDELDPAARAHDNVDALDIDSLIILPSVDTGSWDHLGVAPSVSRSVSSHTRGVARRTPAVRGGAILVTSGLTSTDAPLPPPTPSRAAPGGVLGGVVGRCKSDWARIVGR